MEDIIKKAIEVGWNPDLEYDENEVVLRLVLIDPLFWQALGKACGWEGTEEEPEWLEKATDFHQITLTQGLGKAVEWLEELITS